MKFTKVFLFIITFFTFVSVSTAAENSKKLLNPGWSFKGYFGNLIELHCKEVIKFTLRSVQHVIQ